MKASLVMLMLLACTQATPDAPSGRSASADESSGPRVIFPDGFVVHVELAADDELRAQGLMYRDQLRPRTGMLFLFPEDGEYPFWMKNTLIPLDMIWIDSGKRVVHVKFDVPPCRVENCPSYPPHATARYVLEVAGGVARVRGIKAGDLLQFEQTDRVPVR